MDISRNVVERYNYTPYGEVSVLDGDFSDDADGKSDISNELFYTRRRLDPETGVQLNRRRYYDSHLGRWLSRDPIGYKGGGWNLYEYNNSMPIDKLDPKGTTPKDLSECKAKCLEEHHWWYGIESLTDCYEKCNYDHDKCADMRKQLLSSLTKMCDKKFAVGEISQKVLIVCKLEAFCIAGRIDHTCRNGGRPNLKPVRRGLGYLGIKIQDERHRGLYCYEWAYGFKNACDDCNPEHFDCSVDWASAPPMSNGNVPVHSWCEVKGGDDAVFVDDGFMGGFPGYCHEDRPCGGSYEWPGKSRLPRPVEDGCYPAKP